MQKFHKVKPLHHTVVSRKTEPSGKTFRVILLQDGDFEALILYFSSLKLRGRSIKWQSKVARSVGIFLDYIVQLGHLYHGENRARKLFWDFSYAVADGTMPVDGNIDSTGLYWPSHTQSQLRNILSSIRDFSKWCADNYRAEHLVPDRAATLAERISIYRQLDAKSKKSFFAHLQTSGKNWREAKTTNDLAQSFVCGTSVVRSAPPHFKKDKFSALVSKGFLKYGGQRRTVPWQRYHVRDMMISILQGAAGLRASEPFHLYVDDVEEDSLNPGHARVKLYHPCEGKYIYLDPLGQEVEGTRQSYLRSIGLVPRNLDGHRNYHAGWKNLALFKDPKSGEVHAPVTFFPTHWGKIFWDLYRIYMFRVRQDDLCHPFLFVTERGETAGEPYSLKQYIKKHEKAVQKVLGKKALQIEGTSDHGLRHMYARAIKGAVAGREDEKKIIQYCLRHRSEEAQEIYTAPSLGEIRLALRGAESGIDVPSIPGIDRLQLI